MRDLTGSKDSWKDSVGEALAKNAATSAPGKAPALLPWFASGSVIDVAVSTHSADTRLREQLIYAALADANNPYEGDTIHALGKPDAVYTRFSPETLAERIGDEAAKKMSRSWSREMFGRQVIIGEPLVDESGQELRMDFVGAIEACINLNSPAKRDAVISALLNREVALDAVRKANSVDLKNQVAAIHKAHPIPGIYLMSKEEWDVIEGDLGCREQKYVPQILPKLKARRFWSASVHPRDDDPAFYFNGNDGSVYNYDRYLYKSVRCVR